MSAWKGEFNKQHSPCLEFVIVGKNGNEFTFNGIIDTGFTGFIQIPLNDAGPMGLANGQGHFTKSTIANGSKQLVWLIENIVRVQDEKVSGLCHIPLTKNNSPVLIGVDFLRRFNRVLLVSKKGILLVKEENLKLD
ncbi:MAG: hypothetical protein OXF60_09620 [Gammaproteobacteria bacterium]|nr:hypothetical protein [Gammaproteobacteria bacterium]